jgi:hypothetical protein
MATCQGRLLNILITQSTNNTVQHSKNSGNGHENHLESRLVLTQLIMDLLLRRPGSKQQIRLFVITLPRKQAI